MQTIFLEFQHKVQKGTKHTAAIGSDAITYLDGRWGEQRRRAHIYNKVRELRSGYRGRFYREMFFVGYSVAGTTMHTLKPMKDLNPPEWAKEEK